MIPSEIFYIKCKESANINDEMMPIKNLRNKYFALDISLGRKAKACICTDIPENPSAKATKIAAVPFEKQVDFASITDEFPISKKVDINAKIASF